MNDWYKKVPQTDDIFGTGTPTTKKFEKTQKMFQEAQGTKAEAAGFDRTNDQSWIEWFASKGHEFSTVERLTMERFAAWGTRPKTLIKKFFTSIATKMATWYTGPTRSTRLVSRISPQLTDYELSPAHSERSRPWAATS